MRFPSFALFIFLVFHPALGHGKIYPEDVGSTQYGTGHLAAAMKYRERIDDIAKEQRWPVNLRNKMHASLLKLLCMPRNQMGLFLKTNFRSREQRRILFNTIAKLQKTDQSKVVQLFMIGKKRAVATDGHHRIRTMVQLANVLRESDKLWAEEIRPVMKKHDRIRKNDKIKFSLPLEGATIMDELPKDAKATDVVRSLLERGMGLWENPADNDLARKFSGKKAKDAPKAQLEHLAFKLGLRDSADGIKFIPIVKLPDNSMRTLMGNYFRSRGMKSKKISFQSYVEFFLGTEVKKIVATDSKRFPSLSKLLLSRPSLEDQRTHMGAAMKELDGVFAQFEGLNRKTKSYATEGTDVVEDNLKRIKFYNCGKASLLQLD